MLDLRGISPKLSAKRGWTVEFSRQHHKKYNDFYNKSQTYNLLHNVQLLYIELQ